MWAALIVIGSVLAVLGVYWFGIRLAAVSARADRQEPEALRRHLRYRD